MRNPSPRTNDDALSFSSIIKSEIVALQVKKDSDKRSLAAGIIMPGVQIKGEALDVLNKIKGVLSEACEASLDLNSGARLFLRGVFLVCGYMTDPETKYRIELRPQDEQAYDVITDILATFDISWTDSKRDDIHSIYIMNGDHVADFLGIIGANNARLNFENIRIKRELKSQANRLANCDNGNAGRLAEASAKRETLIAKLLSSPEADNLPRNLYEAAIIHQENPGASIAELGKMMNPPIGKSGMNHRLTRLIEIAENL
ncbi:MAG: DNA-binding protein WhiA [Saccharofermentans sp.]|nr:DNA-binding protein WhiA [Saccharofermentans sp.]